MMEREGSDKAILPEALSAILHELLESGMSAESLKKRVCQVVDVMDGERKDLARQAWVADRE